MLYEYIHVTTDLHPASVGQYYKTIFCAKNALQGIKMSPYFLPVHQTWNTSHDQISQEYIILGHTEQTCQTPASCGVLKCLGILGVTSSLKYFTSLTNSKYSHTCANFLQFQNHGLAWESYSNQLGTGTSEFTQYHVKCFSLWKWYCVINCNGPQK